MYSIEDGDFFYSAFKGNQAAFGRTVTGEMVDGKVEANCKLVYAQPSRVVIAKHLSGEESIGIAPIDDAGNCVFGAIDIDNYQYDVAHIIRAIYVHGLPLLPCWSKSKKLHLYIFFDSPTPADKVIALLEWYKLAFACTKNTEVFPKQSKRHTNQKFFSWINLPYFDAGNEENHRKAIDLDYSLMSLADAMHQVSQIKWDIKRHEAFIKDLWFYSAPICVLQGAMLCDVPPGFRNNWFFSVAVFMRMIDEEVDLQQKLIEVNNTMIQPMNEQELINTVCRGMEKKTYFYICNDAYRCDKKLCAQQEHGITSKESTGLSFGDITQIMTEPPTYTWVINDVVMSFDDEEDIIGQSKFRALCMRELHILPRRVKDDQWSKIVSRAMENIIIQPVTRDDGLGELSANSMRRMYIHTFLASAPRTEHKAWTVNGPVYEDGDKLFFNVHKLTAHVCSMMGERTTKEVLNDINYILERMQVQKEGMVYAIDKKEIPDEYFIKDSTLKTIRSAHVEHRGEEDALY